MSQDNDYKLAREDLRAPEMRPFETMLMVLLITGVPYYLVVSVYHIRALQMLEFGLYLLLAAGFVCAIIWHFHTIKERQKNAWPHPKLYIPVEKDEKWLRQAREKNWTIVGHDVHGDPWYWPNETRAMHGIVLGKSGMGKTRLILNIAAQDIHRVIRTKDGPRRIPMIYLSGKADRRDLKFLKRELAAAGRLHQLCVLDLARPGISVRYNPLNLTEDDYEDAVDFIFESLGLRKDFFTDHQLSYFMDMVRVLVYTGKSINFHDVVVTALDPEVMKEQIQAAKIRIANRSDLSEHRRRALEMSARELLLSLDDKDRVTLIRGLLNPLKVFLREKLAIITGSYDNLITLEEVVEKDLILYVPLNTNKGGGASVPLGRLILHDIQRFIGSRYELDLEDGEEPPLLSIILDEFEAFAFEGFSRVVQTSRGSNIGFLFSLQTVSQLEKVSKWFADDVASAPNTIMLMQSQDQRTVRFFQDAVARVEKDRFNETVARAFFGDYKKVGFGSVTRTEEFLAKEAPIKKMARGQVQILMQDTDEGPLYGHLHVRNRFVYEFPWEPRIHAPIRKLQSQAEGANLRFKTADGAKRGNRNPRKGGQPW